MTLLTQTLLVPTSSTAITTAKSIALSRRQRQPILPYHLLKSLPLAELAQITHDLLTLQHVLCATTIRLLLPFFLTALQISQILLVQSFFASKILAWNLLLVSRFLAISAASKSWKASEPLRKKLFFEFMVWILNPNAVALFIFWPGWIVFGALWWWCG